MALVDAIKHYFRGPGDPSEEWVDEERAALVIEQVYADMQGMSGSRWLSGNGAPTEAALPDARPGDWYLDLDTGDAYRLH